MHRIASETAADLINRPLQRHATGIIRLHVIKERKLRGHLGILVKDEGESACVWSAHTARDGQPAGYGLRRIPKTAMKRVLFTRITRPAAFTNAAALQDEPWLTGLMTRDTTWAECVRRCGINR